jgi:uncharacterized membrane protein YfcA
MDNPKLILFVALGVVAVIYLVVWRRALIAGRARDNGAAMPGPTETAIGFGTNFFDTLGIGSYAPTTALFRFFRLVPDEKIPGTMTLGHTLPTIVQSFIFIAIVNVNFATLVLLIGASIVGAWLGAGVVSRWPRRNIQNGMGLALVAAAVLFTMANLGIVAAGGTALGLTGTRLILGIIGNFVLGAFMTLGIGLYGPCLIMISLLGMEPRAAFPIMMASCAFLMPVAGVQFAKAQAFSARPALGLMLGGIPAVLIAALIVKSMPLVAVRWLVVVVVLIAAAGLLRSAFQRER